MARSLITNSEYYSLTNSTSSTSTDSLISSLISAVTLQIETYCDRTFFKELFIEWLPYCKHTIFPRVIPIESIVYQGSIDSALTITNINTTPYTFSIHDSKMYITNNLTTVSIDLNTTLANIITGITAVASVTVVQGSTVTDNGLLLEPRTLTVLPGNSIIINGGLQDELTARIDGREIRQCGYSRVIGYVAGYDTIPMDLQLICANIVKDTLNVQTNTIKATLKSETITNYSYTLTDNVNFYNIIQAYLPQLNAYKNVIF